MNINKLMKQAQKMQEQMAKTQAELEEKTVEVVTGGGRITVVANGAGDILSIKIAKEVVDPEDVEILEDLILSGVQQAIAKGKEMAGSEMSKLTGGMNLPGLSGLGL
jgi:nucleoid-associated protein EbfC